MKQQHDRWGFQGGERYLPLTTKLTQRYVALLEESNRKLDQKILELSLFNEAAKAFSSSAFDQRNISGFLYKLFRRKIDLSLLALLLIDEKDRCLILTTGKASSPDLKESVRSRMTKRWQEETGQEIAELAVIEIVEGEKETNEAREMYAVPLVVEDRTVGMMGFFFAREANLNPDDRKFLNILAVQTALFVENDRIRQAITDERNKLEAANRELEAFSYSVSHDLRAPLRGIDGFSLALLEDCADRLNEAGKDYLGRIRAATQQMGQLIDDMLNLSRVTRSEIDREKVDLSSLAAAVADELKKGEPGRDVEFRIEPGLSAKGDRRLLKVALENLLGNAWKYTGRHPRARIEFGCKGKIFFVRDDGAGFDMTYADKLFGVFQRLHKAAEFPGTGVGLATVQRIIHKHGGRIWAEGEVEKGAAFYFTIGG
jgi:signal transduction histidine kinase